MRFVEINLAIYVWAVEIGKWMLSLGVKRNKANTSRRHRVRRQNKVYIRTSWFEAFECRSREVQSSGNWRSVADEGNTTILN